ncbi:MAG: GTP-binding protein [Candidatus Protistobacter heckmanni]|nr:GTP-binding protein [Candidatus Protistobacter heckmanni]
MNAPTEFAHVAAGHDLGVLRVITAGSVDDGKSTLIGRLLYDSKAVLADQIASLTKATSARRGAAVGAGVAIDLSLLTDGLEAEREQGITIDVAYRYFATAERKFIIADAPGHEQYTRNMVTGASTADAAIVLIDPTRLDLREIEAGAKLDLLAQTKRHSALLRLLAVRHIIVAVNKMDLVDYSAGVFDSIRAAYGNIAARLGLKGVHYVPVSALMGDNIVAASDAMPWFKGLPLLPLLETLPAALSLKNESCDEKRLAAALHFPVQLVARQDGSSADDFRGYMGRIEAGVVSVGQKIRVQPGNRRATVAEVLGPNGALERAQAGEVVTIRLAEDVDVSRGDVLLSEESELQPAGKLQADLCWFSEEPLNQGRKYWLKQATSTIYARFSGIEHVLDVSTLEEAEGVVDIRLNDIGRVNLTLQKPIVCSRYDDNPAVGSFILIDAATHHTVAAGMIRAYF